MKAAFVTPYRQGGAPDPQWAGYRSVGTLLAGYLWRSGIELSAIGGFREQGILWRGARQAMRNLFASRRYLRFAEAAILRGYARQLEGRLRGLDVDCVISHGWLAVACAELDVPLVIHNDAPLVSLIDYYPYFSSLTDATIARICDAERAALEKAAVAVYASEWAAEGARRAYPSCAGKIYSLPYGPAFPEALLPGLIDSTLDVRERQAQCELLFLGVDWQRKGGPLVVDITRRLNETGFPARLTIAGCTPEISPQDKHLVEVCGFLDFRTPEGAQRFQAIMERSHLLVLPAQAEAFGLVFAEASAYGIPSFATATGGITTAVLDGINGRLFSGSDGVEEYCAAIRTTMESGKYRSLALSSQRDYIERLNWRHIGAQWAELLHAHVVPASHRA